MLLASCSYEEAKKYNNKLVVVSEEETKKPEKVSLNVITSSPEEAFTLGKDLVKCITTDRNPKFCPSDWAGSIFYECTLNSMDDLNTLKIPETKEGIVPLLRLPEGNLNLKQLYNFCQRNPKVRVIGSNLLEIPGIKIGRFDEGKDKMSSVFNGVYDAFTEVALSSIKVKEIMGKVRAKSTSSGPKKVRVAGSKKAPSKPKKVVSFEKLFGEEADEF